jgi:uncharacterized protein YbcI
MNESRHHDLAAAEGAVLADVSSAIVGLQRQYFGRGATRARTFLVHDDLLVSQLDGVLVTHEQTLMAKGEDDVVKETRQTFQAVMRDEFVGAVERITGRSVMAYDSMPLLDVGSVFEVFLLAPASVRLPAAASVGAGSAFEDAGDTAGCPAR